MLLTPSIQLNRGKKRVKKTPLPHFLTWLYHRVHLLIVLPSYGDNRPQKELLYRYPILQLSKKPLSYLLQFKTQDIGALSMGTLCRTPHCVKPPLKYISLNLEAVPADLRAWFFPGTEPSLLSLFASCGLPGSSPGPSAPLLLVQSELPRKAGSRGLQGALCARSPAQGKDTEWGQHSHSWP